MEGVDDHELSPVFEEKTFDETTVFVSENGSISKRRRRKSLGRRVSFAEAPELHIFPRDDEYETPTRGTNGAGSPHREGGHRRSPRLVAKVVDADKENRALSSRPTSQRGRRRGGSKLLSARGEESPALKPANWLDARDPSLQAGDDQENTGPVDLRHLSFNQKETEMDEENITLDSTTFALKSLEQIRSGEPAAFVQLDMNRQKETEVDEENITLDSTTFALKSLEQIRSGEPAAFAQLDTNRLAGVSKDDEGFPDEDVLKDILQNDMSFTMNRRFLRRKSLRQSITGVECCSSDTSSMSLTVQVPRGQRKPHMFDSDDDIDMQAEEDPKIVSDQKNPPTRNPTLAVQGIRTPRTEELKSEEICGDELVDLDDDTKLTTGSEENLDTIGVADKSVCSPTPPTRKPILPVQGINIPGAKELLARSEETFGVDLVDLDQDTKLSTGSEENLDTIETADMNISPQKTSPTRRSILPVEGVRIPRAEELLAQSEGTFGVELVDLDEDTKLTTGSEENLDTVETADMNISPQKARPTRKPILTVQGVRIPRAEELLAQSAEGFGVALVDLDEDTKLTTGSEENLDIIETADMSVSSLGSVVSLGKGERTITMGVPSLTQLIRQEEDEGPSITGHLDRTITLGIPSLKDLIREEEEDGERRVEEGVSLEATPVRPLSRSMWMTPPSSRTAARTKDECSAETEDHIYETTALVTERIPEDGPEISSVKTVAVKEEDAPRLNVKSGDTTVLLTNRIPAYGEEKIIVPKISVAEFLQQTEVHFSCGVQSPRELLKDPSLAETYHLSSVSESFNFLCLIKPQGEVMRDACEELYEEVGIKETAVSELEQRLTASNPEILSYFQRAGEEEKQRIRTRLGRIQGNERLLAEKNRLDFQLRVETEKNSKLFDIKKMIMYYVETTQEQRNMFDEKFHRHFPVLQARLSSRDENQECISNSQSRLSSVKHLRKEVDLERIEDLKERLKDLKSSQELKLAKLSQTKQALEEIRRGLKHRVAASNLSDLCGQVVNNLRSGKNGLQIEDVTRSPDHYVQKMKNEVRLLHELQDGFQVKSAGRDNQDMVLELSYRSLVKRRYVVRKVGTVVKVLRSSWSLQPEEIEETFPKLNALVVFSFALRTGDMPKASAMNPKAWTKMYHRLSASEAVRFTLSSDKPGDIPEPTNLRDSMQVTRILVGNLMELMEEIGKCQAVVHASAGGGVLVVPRFRDVPGKHGRLELELKFIDCILSIKFFLYLDMSCLPLTGYPLGDLPARVETTYCAPKVRRQFKQEILEQLLSRVKPGYQRLMRAYAAVGSFLASIRKGAST
ncbi:unnamed protein product [Calypogeia fissa]